MISLLLKLSDIEDQLLFSVGFEVYDLFVVFIRSEMLPSCWPDE